MIEITAVGGYSEVGKNMTAVKYKDDVVILDMGLHMETYINLEDDDDDDSHSLRDLTNTGAVPDDSVIENLKKKVVAIVPSHGHLDHIGAIPFLAQNYNAPVICTPYTAAVLRAVVADKKIPFSNEIVAMEFGRKMKLSDSITIEFVNVTHSIPHTAIVVIHTPDGKVVYANDFKLDETPTFGEKTDYKKLKELSGRNVKVLILDSLYAGTDRKTPSESVARDMLKQVMLNTDTKGKAVIISTFSSHIARLKSIVEFGKKMKRKIIFMGRSLAKYVAAAESIGLAKFSPSVEICAYKKQMKKPLMKVEKDGRDKYLIVCTGHQGEPTAVLTRLADDKIGFSLQRNDHVIFSCTVIPTETNRKNRASLEKRLLRYGVIIFRDVHESGHASRQDHKELIELLQPEHIIPAHAGHDKTKHMISLAEELGYKRNKTVHEMKDGKTIML